MTVIGIIVGGALALALFAGVGYWLVRSVFGPNDVHDSDRDGDHYE